jgi:hypothetical protein
VLKEPGRGCDILPGTTRKILGKTLSSFLPAIGLERGGRYRRAFRFSVHGEWNIAGGV